MIYFLLTFSLMTSCIGQLLLKKSAMMLARLPHVGHLMLQPLFLLAITLYGLSMVSWVYILQRMPLGRAYMFLSSSFVVLPVLGHCFFGEQLSGRFFIGASFIVMGVLLTTK